MKEDPYGNHFIKEKKYYHCCECGGIYMDKEKTKMIVKLKTPCPLPKILEDMCVTSSFCPPCLDKIMIKRGEWI